MWRCAVLCFVMECVAVDFAIGVVLCLRGSVRVAFPHAVFGVD